MSKKVELKSQYFLENWSNIKTKFSNQTTGKDLLNAAIKDKDQNSKITSFFMLFKHFFQIDIKNAHYFLEDVKTLNINNKYDEKNFNLKLITYCYIQTKNIEKAFKTIEENKNKEYQLQLYLQILPILKKSSETTSNTQSNILDITGTIDKIKELAKCFSSKTDIYLLRLLKKCLKNQQITKLEGKERIIEDIISDIYYTVSKTDAYIILAEKTTDTFSYLEKSKKLLSKLWSAQKTERTEKIEILAYRYLFSKKIFPNPQIVDSHVLFLEERYKISKLTSSEEAHKKNLREICFSYIKMNKIKESLKILKEIENPSYKFHMHLEILLFYFKHITNYDYPEYPKDIIKKAKEIAISPDIKEKDKYLLSLIKTSLKCNFLKNSSAEKLIKLCSNPYKIDAYLALSKHLLTKKQKESAICYLRKARKLTKIWNSSNSDEEKVKNFISKHLIFDPLE